MDDAASWAPLSAVAELWRPASQPSDVTWMPLSQMPMPTPRAVSQRHELDEYALDTVDVESDATLEEDEHVDDDDDIQPIKRVPLRLLSGNDMIDTYAGRWRSGGAYAPLEEDDAVHDLALRGFPVGSALEVAGPPGVGKTTWCIQMAILERLQHVVYWMHECMQKQCNPMSSLMEAMDTEIEPWCAQVVLVDTEGSITAPRIQYLTRHAIAPHHTETMSAFAQWAKTPSNEFTIWSALERCVLRGIHLVRCTTLSELLAFVGTAASTVLKVPGLPSRTSLLIIDTLSFFTYAHALPLNATREQRRAREDAVQYIVRALTTLRDSQIPEHDRLTVIVTMQMTTKRVHDESVLQPSLLPPSAPALSADIESVLGRSAHRFTLAYSDVRAHRYVTLYLRSAIYTSWNANPVPIVFQAQGFVQPTFSQTYP